MRIATWNVERLKHKKQLDRIQNLCNETDADILVLTETDTHIVLNYPYVYYSSKPSDRVRSCYKDSERRVAIYSKTPAIQSHTTFDEETALCMEFETELGNVVVYGTIMGVLGNRDKTFLPDVKSQMNDIQKLVSGEKAICVAGDYNLSFSDNWYFTTAGRNEVKTAFAECSISILTEALPAAIDHIAVSGLLAEGKMITVHEWNQDKVLSDHKGVVLEIG